MNIHETLKQRPIGNISEGDVEFNIKHMNHLLANEYTLFTKTLNFHWNVTGPQFHSIHSFLETHYKDLLVVMDDIAERIRIIGETPLSTLSAMKSEMNLNERSGEHISSNDMIQELFNDHLKIQNDIKDFLSNETSLKNDPGTEDLLTNTLAKHEKMSWMLKSHLQ